MAEMEEWQEHLVMSYEVHLDRLKKICKLHCYISLLSGIHLTWVFNSFKNHLVYMIATEI